MSPDQRRGPWLPQEDQTLLQLVRTQGPNNWVRISQHMKCRSPKQCRERFHQNLKPTLSHKPISADEGVMIEGMVNDFGRRWAEIARRLGNRSDNSVKNWWNGSMNRKRRGGVPAAPSLPSRTHNGRVESPYQKPSMHPPASTDRYSIQLPKPGDLYASWTATPDDWSGNGNSVRFSKVSSPSRQQHPANGDNPSLDTEGRSDFPLSAWSQDNEWTRPTKPRRQSLSRPKLAPIVIHPPHARSDLPVISPSPSEMSNRISSGPPSMISDRNSVASTSPKTVTSPPLHCIPGKFQHPDDDHRRGSVASLPSYGLSSLAHGDSRYSFGGAKAAESYGDVGLLAKHDRDGPSLHNLPGNGSAHQQQRHCHANVLYSQPADYKVPQTAPLPPRDTRMGLQALLN